MASSTARFLCLVFATLLSLWASAGANDSPTAEVSPSSVLSVVFTEPRPGADDLVKEYLEGAFPLAQAQGMREVKAFAVSRILAGDETPQYAGFYTWPSADAARSVRESAEYVEGYKPLRQQAWKEMMAIDLQLSEPWQPAFHPDKTYTLAVVWLASEESYNAYQHASSTLRDNLGARTLLVAPAVRLDYLQQDKNLRLPDRVALLEWPNAAAPDAYRQALSEEPYSSKAGPAFERVDWFEVKPF